VTAQLSDKSGVPFVPWEDFGNYFAWRQDEHVALIGPTGAGKTTLALNLLPLRTYVTVLATKPRDETLDRFSKSHDYVTLKTWKHKLSAEKYPRRILWPDSRSLYAAEAQRREFQTAMASIYDQGSWCTYVDEGWILSQPLRMQNELKTFLLQGRSMDLSLVLATQRPAWIPVEVYDQSTHLFFWRDNDETNLSRISGVSFGSSALIQRIVSQLERHEVLYINTRDNTMLRTMSPKPSTIG